jgi:hypothetical protein
MLRPGRSSKLTITITKKGHRSTTATLQVG